MFVKQLTVSARISESKPPVEASGSVELYSSVEDVIKALSNTEDAQDIIDNLNFAVEQKKRSSIRAKLVAENSGPERAIDKLVKQMLAAAEAIGKPTTQEAVLAQLDAMGFKA